MAPAVLVQVDGPVVCSALRSLGEWTHHETLRRFAWLMKFLLATLFSFGVTYYVVGLLIQGHMTDIAEGLRHRPDAPTPGEYLREVQAHARRARRRYTLGAGAVTALIVCLLLSWLS